jgi:hypothetical protein
MKVLFLDVDGVLNQEVDTGEFFTFSEIDFNCLLQLASIIEDTGAKIVVSSSWRLPTLGSNDPHFKLNKLKNKLSILGLTVHDVTPEMVMEPRSSEIDAWLSQNPEVTNFVILDDFIGLDLMDEFELHHKKHLVVTDPQIGLTQMDVILAKFILLDMEVNND